MQYGQNILHLKCTNGTTAFLFNFRITHSSEPKLEIAAKLLSKALIQLLFLWINKFHQSKYLWQTRKICVCCESIYQVDFTACFKIILPLNNLLCLPCFQQNGFG